MASALEVSAPPRSKLQSVAKYQRYVIFALLGNIAIVILSFLILAGIVSLPAIGIVLFCIAALAITIFMIYSVVMLARQFNNIIVAIICGLAMILPFISLLVLLIYSQKATNYLRTNGVNVGFFGVDPSSI